VGEPVITVRAEDQPSGAYVVHRTDHGETDSVVPHGKQVADLVPSGDLDRLRETIDVLSDADLVHELAEGLADGRAGRVFCAVASRRPVANTAKCPWPGISSVGGGGVASAPVAGLTRKLRGPFRRS
jgi:hypothetical protein